jgi:hypothetical protein
MNLAEKFASHIDKKQFDEASAMIAQDCVYTGGETTLEGRDGVTQMYRMYAQEMGKMFDEIRYESEVEVIDGDTCRIVFTDSLRKGDSWHDTSTSQIVRFNQDGLVSRIEQRDIPGQAEAMREWWMKVR